MEKPLLYRNSFSPDNLAKWDVERWSDLQDDLEHIRDILLRQDAVLNLKDESMAENPEMDEERAEMASFGKKYQILIQCLEVNKAIAPIRWDLEEQILKTDEGQPELDKKKVAEVVRIISEIKNERCVEVAETLFAKKPAKKNKGTETFEDISALAKILDSKPFNLSYVQNKIEVVLRRWSCDTFGSDDPMLFRLRYGIPPRSGLALLASTPALARRTPSKSTGGQRSPVPSIKKEDEDDEDIQRLRENRVALGEGHGEDPLEESRTLAAEAAGEGRKRTADNQDEDEEQDTKRVRRLAIDDELDEDDEEDEKERAALSELPRRRTRRPSRRFTGPPPDDGIFDEQGKVKARRKWAEEEKNAVKVGSQKFGVGKWAEIKKEYGDILRNRTSVQIKDCWRTMNKNNEV